MKWNEMKDAWHTERGNWIDRKCLIWTFKGEIIDRESKSSNYAHEFRNLSVTSFETNNNKNTINRPMLSNFSNKTINAYRWVHRRRDFNLKLYLVRFIFHYNYHHYCYGCSCCCCCYCSQQTMFEKRQNCNSNSNVSKHVSSMF